MGFFPLNSFRVFICIRHLSHCGNRIPDEICSQKGALSGLTLPGQAAHHGSRDAGAGAGGAWSHDHRSQEAESNERWHPAAFCLFILCRNPVHATGLPMCRMGLCTSAKPMWESLTDLPRDFSTSWPSRISLRVRVSHSLSTESAAWMPQRDRRKRPYQDRKKQPHQGRRKCLMWTLKPADTKQALTFKRLRSGFLLTQLWAGTGEEQGLLCLNMETMPLNFYLFIQRKSWNQLCWWEHMVGGLQQGREDSLLGFRYHLVTFRALGWVATGDLLTYSKRICLTSQGCYIKHKSG